MTEGPPRWLAWAREIQALAQTGLHYAENPFEAERARRLLEIAAEIIEAHADLPMEKLRLAFEAQPGYVTPKVDVRAAVFQDEEILLVREAIDGGWTLPGGWADVGEAPSLAVEREVLEEAGLEVKAKRLIGVYDANRVPGALDLFHAYKLLFLCEWMGGELRSSQETTQVGFFGQGGLPGPLSEHRTTRRHLRDAFAARQDEQWRAVFD